jgi:hypothetical protein
MAFTSTDLIYVDRGGTHYKVEYGDRDNDCGSGGIADTDLLLVERSNTKYKCTRGDWDSGDCTTVGGQNIYSSTYSPVISVHCDTSSGDSTRAYDILNQQVSVGGSSQSGNLYIGQKNNATTSYYGDLPIGCVQIFNSSSVLQYAFHFHHTAYTWTTTTTSTNSSASTAPSTLSYSSISSSACTTTYRYCRATSTGSSYTGAADNIGTGYGTASGSTSGVSSLPSSGTVSQSSGTYYLFGEMSGTTTGRVIWMKSPTITMNDGDYVRIAYLAETRCGGSGTTTANTLLLYWA